VRKIDAIRETLGLKLVDRLVGGVLLRVLGGLKN
jgi:hypothetical protein